MNKENVPNFTKSDFLETDRPYKFVAESEKNQPEKDEIFQLVNERAKSFGINNFSKLLCAFKKQFGYSSL